MHSIFFFICDWWKDTELVHAIFAKIATFQRPPLPSHLNFFYTSVILAINRHFPQIRHFRQNRHFPIGPLCHLICIFVYSLAISVINRHFCHFRQHRHFSKGPLCHLICISLYHLAILAVKRQFCHFHQICHFHQNRHFSKGPFAISFVFLFTVWRFWRLIANSTIFANIATFPVLQFGDFSD